MRLKKLTAFIAIVVLCLAAIAPSVFATDNQYDSMDTAYVLSSSETIQMTILDGTDRDWFSFYDSSRLPYDCVFSMTPPSGKNYDLDWVLVSYYGDTTSGTISSGSAGVTETLSMRIYAGGTLYIKVRGSNSLNYDSVNPYNASFTATSGY